MVITMKPGALSQQIKQVNEKVEAAGYVAKPVHGVEQTVIAVVGSSKGDLDLLLEQILAMPGVETAVRISEHYKLVSRKHKPQGTQININGCCVIGGVEFPVMAGPCSVESESQVRAVAETALLVGAKILRGGAFKPRTSPYAFQGLGKKGLEILRTIKRDTGLAVITEIMHPEHVSMFEDHEVDILQVGARNMQNFDLLKAVGKSVKPVLLKRGMSATIDEWLMSAEYVASEGNPNIILCERGIRTFETALRNTFDIAAVPLLAKLTHLPVIVDPSHATGNRELVKPLSIAAAAIGAHGLIVEVHPKPEEALSDGAQSLTLPQFKDLMVAIRPYIELRRLSFTEVAASGSYA